MTLQHYDHAIKKTSVWKALVTVKSIACVRGHKCMSRSLYLLCFAFMLKYVVVVIIYVLNKVRTKGRGFEFQLAILTSHSVGCKSLP